MLAGNPVREFGVNVPDLLVRWINGGMSTSNPCPFQSVGAQTTVFQTLAAANLRFIRFAPMGHRPKTYRVGYVGDQATFLGHFDDLVVLAEQYGMLLIPSLCFSSTQIPPYKSEYLSAWANSSSDTISEMNALVDVIVARYKGSPAIAMWEWANEVDAQILLNPPVFSRDTTMETPASWVSSDVLPLSTTNVATAAFHARVRGVDTAAAHPGENPRATCSGNNGWIVNTTRKFDHLSYLAERLYNDQTDTIGVHTYPGQGGWYDSQWNGYHASLLRQRLSYEGHGKPMILGEFGVPSDATFTAMTRDRRLETNLSDIQQAGIQLAMQWAYMMDPFVGEIYDLNPAVTGAADFARLAAAQARYRLN